MNEDAAHTNTTELLIRRIVQEMLVSHHLAFAQIGPDLRVSRVSENFHTILPDAPPFEPGMQLAALLFEFIEVEPVLRKVLRGELAFYQLDQVNRLSANTGVKYIDLRVIPLDERQPGQGLLLLIEDASQTGQLEQTLVQDRNRLRLAQEQLMQAKERLEQLNRQKSLFLSMAAHDMRSPLAAIRGYTDLLNEALGANGSSELSQLVTIIQVQTSRLDRLITDFLDLDLIEQGKLPVHLEHCDLNAVVEENMTMMGEFVQRQGLELEADLSVEPVWALADPSRLRQICANLLSNAIKYTPKGGRIRVHTCQEQEQVVLRVQDTGRGIPPDEMKNLFKLYHRIEKSEYGWIRGTGLGLFIVKSLVDAQNGCVEVHSDARNGTIFTVRLPLASQQR